MYDLRLGYGCGIKATLLTPANTQCDLRRVRYIGAVLVLPNGSTMPCEDLSFDEVTNAVYVRLLPTRELTVVGTYGIVFNVKLDDNTMYSTQVVNILDVSTTAAIGYQELTISMSLTVVNFPSNVSYTGASPKIGVNNTWLVYDDTLNAYVDTGVEVGYANLISRYDAKIAEITAQVEDIAAAAVEQPISDCNDATDAAQSVVSTYDDVINALAHSDCSVEQRIATLESLLTSIFAGDIIVPALKVSDLVSTSTDIVKLGTGAPSVVPDRSGQFYIDTTAKTLYYSTGNSAISDWNLA